MSGRVFLISTGVGDPDLVTVRAAERLAEADAIVGADDDAIETAVKRAKDGATIAFAIVGDPLGARGERIVAAARSLGVPFEIVPGLSFESAACAMAGISLEGRTRAYVVSKSSLPNTVGVARAEGFSGDTPAALIGWPLRPRTKTVRSTLDSIAKDAGAAASGVLAYGEGVGNAVAFGWSENRPLFGARVLVTRASEQASETAKALRARGALPIEIPTIVLAPPTDPSLLETAVRALERYRVIAFTSANGVDAFFRALTSASLDSRALGHTKIATIGPGTERALRKHGLRGDLVAEEHRGEALAEAILAFLRALPEKTARVLLPRAEVARDALPDALRAAGFEIDVVPAYRSLPPDAAHVADLRRRLDEGTIDIVLFSASSTVSNLCDAMPDAKQLLERTIVATIGPITSATCRARGVRVDVEASPYTIPALLDALEAHMSKLTVRS